MAAEIIEVHSDNPNPRTIAKIVAALKKHAIIIYPTDTVYSVGCDINSIKAMERLAKLKNTNLKKARFSIVCNDLSHLSHYTKQTDRANYKMLKRAFPGPFTIVMEAAKTLPLSFNKHKTVGIRVPDHRIPQEIVSALGSPIVSTSIRDEYNEMVDYITSPEKMWDIYKNDVDIILDAGEGGLIPSTVVDISNNYFQVLREGKGDVDVLD